VNLSLVDGLTTASRFHDARDLDDVTTFLSACLTSRCEKISNLVTSFGQESAR
jgi:hypothetical protein